MGEFLLVVSDTSETWFILLILVLVVWSLVWKGLALWKAARLSDKRWFVVLLILNTAGILEIIYIYLIAKNKRDDDKVDKQILSTQPLKK